MPLTTKIVVKDSCEYITLRKRNKGNEKAIKIITFTKGQLYSTIQTLHLDFRLKKTHTEDMMLLHNAERKKKYYILLSRICQDFVFKRVNVVKKFVLV